MVQGTASHAGKSTVVAGLCRVLSDAGYSVAPFKAQNMSLNSAVAIDGGELAMSQYVQAGAARAAPRAEMNPVLLKPNGDTGSQVVVRGIPVADLSVEEYYGRVDEWKSVVDDCYAALARDFDVVVAEGAGSPAEINIPDFANMQTAELMDAPVILVADIERGGTFAAIHGTVELLGDDSERIAGFLVNKFRGDEDRLRPGIERIQELTGKRCLGVIPYSKTGLPAEDSLSLEDADGEGDVAVVRHRRISNFTDVDPLVRAGMGVRYVSPGGSLGEPDAVVLPGTKRTLDDLRLLSGSDLLAELRRLAGEVPIVGICGGYQMLGERVVDRVECLGEERGAGLLPVETSFDTYDKVTKWSEVRVPDRCEGLLDGVERLKGYEIHTGETPSRELDGLGATADGGMTLGVYLHGLFHNPRFLERFSELVGVKPREAANGDPFDAAADLLRGNVDLEGIGDLLEVSL
ncbi:MAG: Cobyric acid synthase [Methanonatronarchaeales archaeon]|nr:Cobyric acid synthase [Methanonatronarchaeales archaeon]